MNEVPQAHSIFTARAVAPCLRTRREEAANYHPVIATLNDTWRVIDCRDGIQWILQRKAGYRHGQPRWDGRSYCRTRDGLMARVRALSGQIAASAEAILEGLPGRHP